MPRSLAVGHEKIAVLTTKPVDPANPTVTELNAGIDAAPNVLESDWVFGPTASEQISEPSVADEVATNTYGASNYEAGATIFRSFDATTKNAHATEDALFAATKVKGTTLYIYARKTAKKSPEAWAAGDEIRLGAEVITDQPQDLKGGYVKARVPMEVQRAWPDIEAAAGS